MESTVEEEYVAVRSRPEHEESQNHHVICDNIDNRTFEEILPSVGTESSLHMVEALYVHVEPKQCSCVLKELSDILPLEEDLVHLKRVRKGSLKKSTSNKETNESSNKRPKLLLQILLGSRKYLEEHCNDGTDSCSTHNASSGSKIHRLIEKYGPLNSVMLPGRPPRSNDEWKDWNNTIWPIQFFPLKTEEYQRRRAFPSPEELSSMTRRIEESITKSIVMAVDPTNDTIVSICRMEREQQQQQQQTLHELSSSSQYQRLTLDNNPLATPILLAIQGVSRKERQALFGTVVSPTSCCVDDSSDVVGNVPTSKKKIQYLCTGYDMYCYYEPTIFEAMACLHSRLRRLIYFEQRPHHTKNNGNGGTEIVVDQRDEVSSVPVSSTVSVFPNACSKHFIHNLQGTNHRYRAFQYYRSDAIVGIRSKNNGVMTLPPRDLMSPK
jgi:tRNA(Arg) A34 adenosine deaminase TadA